MELAKNSCLEKTSITSISIPYYIVHKVRSVLKKYPHFLIIVHWSKALLLPIFLQEEHLLMELAKSKFRKTSITSISIPYYIVY